MRNISKDGSRSVHGSISPLLVHLRLCVTVPVKRRVHLVFDYAQVSTRQAKHHAIIARLRAEKYIKRYVL